MVEGIVRPNKLIKAGEITGTTFCYDSPFFGIASELTERGGFSYLESITTAESGTFDYTNSYEPGLHQPQNSKFTKLTLGFNDLPVGVEKPTIICCGSPEALAVTVGRLRLSQEKNKVEFQLPRFHNGTLAQLDHARSMFHVAQHPDVRKIFEGKDPTSEAFGIFFTREGYLSLINQALFFELGQDIPMTMAHVRHHKDSNVPKYHRVTQLDKINDEGLNPSELKVLVLGDNTASGMQVIDVGQKIIDFIEETTGSNHKIETLLVSAPILALLGAGTISKWAALVRVRKTVFLTDGGVLESCPETYFSPLASGRLVVEPKLTPIHYQAYGDIHYMGSDPNGNGRKPCVRGNWSGSLMATNQALDDSNAELADFGTTNQDVMRISQTITDKTVSEAGVNPNYLAPMSSFIEAKQMGRLQEFKDILTSYSN